MYNEPDDTRYSYSPRVNPALTPPTITTPVPLTSLYVRISISSGASRLYIGLLDYLQLSNASYSTLISRHLDSNLILTARQPRVDPTDYNDSRTTNVTLRPHLHF